MKKLIVLSIILIVVFTTIATAQSPQKVNYQAVVRDASGNAITDKTISLRISILRESAFGTYLYVETHSPLTNQFGLVTLAIGDGIVTSGSFSGIDWSSGPYFLKVELDAAGGTSYSEMGTTQLLSVPYSLYSQNSGHSQTAATVETVDYNQLGNKPDLSVYTQSAGTGKWDKDSTNDVTLKGDQKIAGKKSFGDSLLAVSTIKASINNSTGTAIIGENKSINGSTYGVKGVISSSSGSGMYGLSLAEFGYGVTGESPSIGVIGYSSSTSGTNGIGVYGNISSPGGLGVSGVNFASTGDAIGVYGKSSSVEGSGVFGINISRSGNAFGVYGKTQSTTGKAVYGEATSLSGWNYGIYGTTPSTNGRGVCGSATSLSGVNYGIYGTTSSNAGRGVYGEATAETGNTLGVYGKSVSSGGVGVYGSATSETGGFGVSGESQGTNGMGVSGVALSATGYNYGVYGRTSSINGKGVYGKVSAETGLNYGVYGTTQSTSGIGVCGNVTSPTGVVNGVYGVTSSVSGRGVWGESKAGTGNSLGVLGTSESEGGTGVYGLAYSTSGVNYGVKGYSTSATGFDFYAFGHGVNYGSSSSKRWKNDIVPITGTLAKLKNMRGVYFTWDNEHGGQHDLGFIGEEVAGYFPEVVVNDPEAPGFIIGMDYGKMTPILLQAINEQQVIIETQNKQILDLLKRVEALETK
jgi:hypothetical protein